jgi:hypothetical protein
MPDDIAASLAVAERSAFAIETEAGECYGRLLLQQLGAHPQRSLSVIQQHPAVAFARSGLMWLTGAADGEPQMCPVAIASCADGALAALASLSPEASALDHLRGAALLAERAAWSGATRRGDVSAGGSCRLLSACDARLAVNLARDEDWSLVPAWLQAPAADWPQISELVIQRPADELVQRARWLGLAVVRSEIPPVNRAWANRAWFTTIAEGPRKQRRENQRPRVLDLSSLWAGPLCGRLLAMLGAEVVKLESVSRPDGARSGSPVFFDAMNAGKLNVAIDLTTAAGCTQLSDLLDSADIVIEASRPRALRQLGIDAEARIRNGNGQTWISITGYGRRAPQDQWIAYGDDAGVAGGLTELLRMASGQTLLCADAIGDPLTGLHAALAAWAVYQQGGGRLLSIPMRDVVAQIANFDRPHSASALRTRWQGWQQLAAGEIAAPAADLPRGQARPLGADTAKVLRDWRVEC